MQTSQQVQVSISFINAQNIQAQSPLPYKTEKEVHLACPELYKGPEPRLQGLSS